MKSRTTLLQRVGVVRVWCVGNCALLARACLCVCVYVFECAGGARSSAESRDTSPSGIEKLMFCVFENVAHSGQRTATERGVCKIKYDILLAKKRFFNSYVCVLHNPLVVSV